MAIFRKVVTEVYCDICGEQLAGWESAGTGVSKNRAARYVRDHGCTTGKRIICKRCRVGSRIEKCRLKKEGKDSNGDCLGAIKPFYDGPADQCKHCIALSSYIRI